jgi:hypothetical protein
LPGVGVTRLVGRAIGFVCREPVMVRLVVVWYGRVVAADVVGVFLAGEPLGALGRGVTAIVALVAGFGSAGSVGTGGGFAAGTARFVRAAAGVVIGDIGCI